jgi:hypothetical protein
MVREQTTDIIRMRARRPFFAPAFIVDENDYHRTSHEHWTRRYL